MTKGNSHKMTILGVMSGTSLDGLDLALCSFDYVNGKYRYKILKAKTVAYTNLCANTLRQVHGWKALQYASVHASYGKLIGEEINKFLKKSPKQPNAIASHGHTVFHKPQLGFSSQIGCGATIAAVTGLGIHQQSVML